MLPLLVMLAMAASIDHKQRRIPNWLTFGMTITGLVRAGILAGGIGIGHSLLGLVVGASVPLVLFAIGALGGGDVKLMGGVGTWIGPGPVFAVFLIQAVLGMMIVVIQAAMQGRTKALFRNTAVIAAGFAAVGELGLENAVHSGKTCRSIDRPLPYAVPVFLATVIVLMLGQLAGS
jgi:prepilin peptidase CpaA